MYFQNMTTLWISTSVTTSEETIASALAEKLVESQVYKNISSITCKDKGYIEVGYKIVLLNVEKEDFIDKVWNVLQPILNLKCAHIKYKKEYRGCIMNWPEVFVQSRCELGKLPDKKPIKLHKI